MAVIFSSLPLSKANDTKFFEHNSAIGNGVKSKSLTGKFWFLLTTVVLVLVLLLTEVIYDMGVPVITTCLLVSSPSVSISSTVVVWDTF